MAKKTAIAAIKSAAKTTVEEDKSDGSTEEDFFADPDRQRCFDLVVAGVSKAAIARELNKHRNTINNWCADPRFIAAARQWMREHQSAKRQRRMVTTNVINDKIEDLVLGQVKKLELQAQNPKTPIKGEDIRTMRELAYEYRSFREEERKDMGDDVKRVSVNSNHSHTLTGDVQVTHSVSNTPFKAFVKQQMDSRIIDVEALDAPNQGALLLQATEHILADSDLLDQIDAEDRENEALLAAEQE